MNEKKEEKKERNNNKLKEDLRFNIERANEIVRLSENRRYKFLEINLALVTAFSFLLIYILDNFNIAGKMSMITSMIIYFGLTSKNIVFNLQENRTKGIVKTLCSERGWKHYEFGKIMIEIENYTFETDYKIQLINLHKYQKNYNKIGRETRIITLTGLMVLLITFFISIIINSFGDCIRDRLEVEFIELDSYAIITIILWNIIPSLVIVVIVWYFKYFREKKKEKK